MVQAKLHITVPSKVKEMIERICADTNLKTSAIVTIALTEYYQNHYSDAKTALPPKETAP